MIIQIVDNNSDNILYSKDVDHLPNIGDDIFIPSSNERYLVTDKEFHYYDDDVDVVLIKVEAFQ